MNIEKRNIKKRSRGFTLIEILVVIGIIAVLAGIVLVAVNPARQFKIARDSQRTSNVLALLNAIGQNISEHKGQFYCNGSPLDFSTATTTIRHDSSGTGIDLAPCLVPDYLSSLPYDPSAAGAGYSSSADYDTEYSIIRDPDGRLMVFAAGEISPLISATR